MKHSSMLGKLPWDMVVFLSITMAGLGVSFKRLAYPDRSSEGVDLELVERDVTSVSKGSSSIVDLGCLDRKAGNERLTFGGTEIRLKGKFCNLTRREIRAFGGIKVKNLSTGVEGTVFFQGSTGMFVSDSILLAKGKNRVQLEWKQSSGSDPVTLVADIFEN